jgi:hypothetical membrane protein
MAPPSLPREEVALPQFTGNRALLLAGLAAPVVLIVAGVVAGDFEPGYSHVSQFVSELGAAGAAHQKVFNYAGLLATGLLTVLFALGMYLRVKPGGWFVTSSLLVGVAGFGRLVAGVFPCDAGCVIENMSNTATVHAFAGFVALTSGAVAPLSLAMGLRKRGKSQLLTLSVGLGSASLILIAVLFGLGKGIPYVGVIQRLALAAFYGWIVAVALKIEALQPNWG